MQRLFVVDRDFFAGMNVAQRKEEHVAVDCAHECIWGAAVIDVMRAVAATTAIETPTAIDIAGAQDAAVRRSSGCLLV